MIGAIISLVCGIGGTVVCVSVQNWAAAAFAFNTVLLSIACIACLLKENRLQLTASSKLGNKKCGCGQYHLEGGYKARCARHAAKDGGHNND